MGHRPSLLETATSALTADTRGRLARTLDATFFWIGTFTAIWLLWVLAQETFEFGLSRLWFPLPIYLLLAYLILPRLHTGLSRIYLPDYFIGRTRTREGILGDPVNLALLGEEAQIHAAMRAAGWTPADPITGKSTWKIIATTLARKSYPEAPVSDLYVFSKRQDFAYQREVDGNPSQRHHVRFWKAPEGWLLPGGHRTDWVAAGTYDRKVGFSLFTLQVTHKIEQNTDIERDFIVQTLETSDPQITNRVIKDFSTGYHSRNGGGDSIETDGDLPVINLRKVQPAIVVDDGTEKPVTLIRAVRPIGTALGSLLILLRSGAWLTALFNWVLPIIATFLNLGTLNVKSGDIELTEKDFTSPGGAVLVIAAILILLVLLVGPLLLTVSVFRGHNWSRVVVMFMSATTIAIAITAHATGVGLGASGGLLGISLDVSVLLALSGSDARRYTLERRAERKRNQRPSRQARTAVASSTKTVDSVSN
jgi:hypothetical protein